MASKPSRVSILIRVGLARKSLSRHQLLVKLSSRAWRLDISLSRSDWLVCAGFRGGGLDVVLGNTHDKIKILNFQHF